MNKNKKKAKELKGIQRQSELDSIRKYGDGARLPRTKIFKDKKHKREKYRPGDE